MIDAGTLGRFEYARTQAKQRVVVMRVVDGGYRVTVPLSVTESADEPPQT